MSLPLHKIRQAQDMTLREFAEALGMRPSQVSDLETGRANADGGVLARISGVLRISRDAALDAIKASKAHAEATKAKGPGVAIQCGPKGCQVVPTLDGKTVIQI